MLGGKAAGALQVSRNTRSRDIPRKRVREGERERERRRERKPFARREKVEVDETRSRAPRVHARKISIAVEWSIREAYIPSTRGARRWGTKWAQILIFNYRIRDFAQCPCAGGESACSRGSLGIKETTISRSISRFAACSAIDLGARFRASRGARARARRAFPRPDRQPIDPWAFSTLACEKICRGRVAQQIRSIVSTGWDFLRASDAFLYRCNMKRHVSVCHVFVRRIFTVFCFNIK